MKLKATIKQITELFFPQRITFNRRRSSSNYVNMTNTTSFTDTVSNSIDGMMDGFDKTMDSAMSTLDTAMASLDERMKDMDNMFATEQKKYKKRVKKITVKNDGRGNETKIVETD